MILFERIHSIDMLLSLNINFHEEDSLRCENGQYHDKKTKIIIKLVQPMEGNPPHITTLQQLIQQLRIGKNYKQALKHSSTNYSITQYKINKLRLEEIPELVNLIEVNYINLEKQNQQVIEKKKNSWLANQLKLFVWMAVCHSYLKNKPLEEYCNRISTNGNSSQLFQLEKLQMIQIFNLNHSSKITKATNKSGKKKNNYYQKPYYSKLNQKHQNKWNQVSRLMYFQSNKKYYRSSQKCRQYWFNHLDHRLNKTAWTVEEDLRLVSELLTYGFKWSKLTQVIESTWGYRRTQHMVKNRTKLLCRKYGYKDEKQQGCMKQLKMIEKKLRQQKQKQQRQQSSLPQINQVKQQESVEQKSFFIHSNNITVDNNGGNGKSVEKKQTEIVVSNNNRCKEQKINVGILGLMGKKSDMMVKQTDNNHTSVNNVIGSKTIRSDHLIIKSEQQPVTMEKLPLVRGNHQLSKNDKQNNDKLYSSSQSNSSDYYQSQSVKEKKHNKGKINKDKKKNRKSRKAKRPVKKVAKKESSEQQSQSQPQRPLSLSSQQSSQSNPSSSLDQPPRSWQAPKGSNQNPTRRNVIILYQGGNPSNHPNQPIEAQQFHSAQPLIDNHSSQQSSSQMIIGEHVDEQQQQKENRQYDRQSESQHNDNNQQYYYDEYNIIERVPEQQQIVDLNQDIQFQHDTHGGKMRERVTHQLAKYFPTDN